MFYTIRAYKSRVQAELGRVEPLEDCTTGDWHNAQFYARQMSKDHGFAILVNTASGRRYEFEKGHKID